MWLWDSRTHQQIVSIALEKCNKSFVNLLQVHQELYILGIESPDRIFKDFTNHYYNCTPNEYGAHTGSVIKKIKKEIELITRMMQNPDKIILHPKTAPFLKNLLNSPLKAFIFELGVISHYIADLHQPMHTDGKYRFADEVTVHKILESDTRLHLGEFEISSERRKRIKDPTGFFTFQIFEINSFYDELIDRYYLKTGKVKPDRWQHSKQIIKECISLVAANIANIYLSFEEATKIYKNQKKYAQILQRANKFTSYKNKYKIKKYKSGTLSLQAKRR